LDINNPQKKDGVCLLHTAVWFRWVGVVEWLLKYKADVFVKTHMGNTPMHFVCEHASCGLEKANVIAGLLLAAGADIKSPPNNNNKTPEDLLNVAGRALFTVLGQVLSERPADAPEPEPANAKTILHYEDPVAYDEEETEALVIRNLFVHHVHVHQLMCRRCIFNYPPSALSINCYVNVVVRAHAEIFVFPLLLYLMMHEPARGLHDATDGCRAG
jgi:hypothetical protein